MIRSHRIVCILPATFTFLVLGGYLNLFAGARQYAAYDDRGWPRDCIVGFYHLNGWPFESYEFVEGKLHVLREPRENFRLESLTYDQYLLAYGENYDTGMTNAVDRWQTAGIAANALLAALPSLAVAALMLLWGNYRSGRSGSGDADNAEVQRPSGD